MILLGQSWELWCPWAFNSRAQDLFLSLVVYQHVQAMVTSNTLREHTPLYAPKSWFTRLTELIQPVSCHLWIHHDPSGMFWEKDAIRDVKKLISIERVCDVAIMKHWLTGSGWVNVPAWLARECSFLAGDYRRRLYLGINSPPDKTNYWC